MHAGKSPNRELQVHIVEGGKHPTGDGLVRIIDDADVNLNDPMEFGGGAGLFESPTDDSINSQNLANAEGLISGYGEQTESFSHDSAARNDDPGKGAISYGRQNIGDR